MFPVGGGSGRRLGRHDHHDYPAADIAAPEGAPVFALADAIVLAARRRRPLRNRAPPPDRATGSAGSTATSRNATRRRAGALLFAGQWVGLVGSTGHSTGPHLHLGLKPETSYPQEMPWFQEFAGIAFIWQDEPTEPLPSSPIFAAVPSSGCRTRT